MSETPVKVEVKVPGESIDKATADLLQKALAPAIGETGNILGDFVGVLGDKVRAWRYMNRIRIITAAKETLASSGINLDEIRSFQMNEIPRLIESISDVDEPEVSKLWSGLIASALTPGCEYTASRTFTSVLNELSRNDAILFSSGIFVDFLTVSSRKYALNTSLDYASLKGMDISRINKITEENRKRLQDHFSPAIDWINSYLSAFVDSNEAISSAENLERIGLIDYGPSNDMSSRNHRIPFDIAIRDVDEIPSVIKNLYEALQRPSPELEHWKKYPVTIRAGFMPALNFHVTDWGKKFASACKIAPPDDIQQIFAIRDD